eukprot:TRINITY_DN2423_c0_g1_i6.p1 TRINITY_DN2423_c0_g1~~TRINITY_DN2423_c0_g1_i6.p1  ORF type:complete len:488 (-),score=47.26 TRINITY_DN2423_c0_g1_i6:316-1779(-)
MEKSQGSSGTDIISGEVQPVFRIAPYTQEVLMKHKNSSEARILFLDEGNQCRSILAEAFTKHILSLLKTPLPVSVQSASIGPPIKDPRHFSRLSRIASKLGIKLPLSQKDNMFQEFEHMVEYDLVLVMDRFDYEDVYKEVAVVDVINPGGQYTNKIKCLGEFQLMLQGKADMDTLEISDPFYGIENEDQIEDKLLICAKQIQQGIIGLVAYLLALNKSIQHKFDQKTAYISLQQALEQSLQCPLLSEHLVKNCDRRPLQTQQIIQETQAIRFQERQAETEVSKRTRKGYWQDPSNVETQLRTWMAEHNVRGRMPSQRELRRSGANSLAIAIDKLGGYNVFAYKLGLPANCQKAGHWKQQGMLEMELIPYLGRAQDGQVYMPSQKFLQKLGRNDLVGAIQNAGGQAIIARRLGVNIRRGKYTSVEGVLKEIVYCLKLNGWGECRLPTAREFESIGRKDIVNAIKKYGGFAKVSQMLQLDYQRALKSST